MHPIRIARRATPLALALSLAAPATVLAHAELASSTPADGATLDAPPSEVVLVFEGELTPEDSEFSVVAADGTEVGTGDVDLSVAERNEMRGSVQIGAEGIYTVRWTAATPDGHEPRSGEVRFTYGAEPAAVGGAATSNTAASPHGRSAAAALGTALVALAGAMALGRALEARRR